MWGAVVQWAYLLYISLLRAPRDSDPHPDGGKKKNFFCCPRKIPIHFNSDSDGGMENKGMKKWLLTLISLPVNSALSVCMVLFFKGWWHLVAFIDHFTYLYEIVSVDSLEISPC